MNRESLLKISIYKMYWFALENIGTNPKIYSNIVTSLRKSFEEVYGKDGAKEYVNLLEKDGKVVLFISDKKVPNVIKAIVNNNKYNIGIELHGIDKDGNEKERVISKPFEQERCTELIPCYNNYGQSQTIQKKLLNVYIQYTFLFYNFDC